MDSVPQICVFLQHIYALHTADPVIHLMNYFDLELSVSSTKFSGPSFF
jgi:hypothetical protein